MASNAEDLPGVLNTCNSLHALDDYIHRNHISINSPIVVARRNELLNAQLITDSDTYKLLKCCCNTLTDLQKLILDHGLDVNDSAVQARTRDLQVCTTSIGGPVLMSTLCK